MSPTEPSADLRQMASFFRQMFIALTSEGFAEKQALTILGETIQASINANRPKE